MKKRILAALLILSVIGLMLAGCADTRDDGTVKVGISIQSLSNAYWAGVMGKLEEQMEARGWDYTIVGCENNAGTQVGQVENFIISGCDLIMVHPADAESLEGICGEAMEADIKVMCWDDPMENTTANWVLDNTDLGREIGKTAAEFINGHYTEDEKALVTVIGYPSTKVLLERADGIKEGLEESCEDNYEIIAEVDGLDANVFVGVCAGAMIGSNEALLAEFGKGNIPDNYGVITTDVTQQQLDSLEAGNEAVRAIVGFEGSNEDTAKACAEMFARILSGEDFSSDRNVYREIAPITLENVEEIQKGM